MLFLVHNPMSGNMDDDQTILMPKPEPTGKVLAPGTRLAEFELLSVIGQGGFGIVYLARDHSLQRDVALKEYMPATLAVRNGDATVSLRSEKDRELFESGLRSFVNEARLLAQFDHPALLKVFRFWEQNGTAYMVMPLYQGMTLKQYLTQHSPPTEAWLRSMLGPILDALAQMHAQQCYHRDIAPDNILLQPDGKPVLLDFGSARRVIDEADQELTAFLKKRYSPIEQYNVSSSMKQGPWTDLYALASVAYFAVIGQTPEPAVSRAMQDNLIPLQQQAAGRYSQSFLCAIDAALAVKPEARPQDVAAFRALLDRPADTPPTLAHAAPPPANNGFASKAPTSDAAHAQSKTEPKDSKPRHTLYWWLAGAGATALLGFAAWFALTPPQLVNRSAAAPPSSARAELPRTAPVPPPAQPASTEVASKPEFQLDSAMDEILQQASSSIKVEAAPQSDRVKIKHDRIAMSIKSSVDGYVYVLLRGSDGEFILLYPNNLDRNNRIKAGQTLNLPRTKVWNIQAAGPAGKDRFIAMVAPYPRDFSALQPHAANSFQVFPVDSLRQIHTQHQGPTPLLAGKAQCKANASPCNEQYGAAGFSIEEFAE